jgi:hypothetical protein
MTAPVVDIVAWDQWPASAGNVFAVAGWWDWMMGFGSPVQSVLSQYFINGGYVEGGWTIHPSKDPSPITRQQIEAGLTEALRNGQLRAPGPNRLYVIYMPAGKRVDDWFKLFLPVFGWQTFKENSRNGAFCGLQGFLTNPTGNGTNAHYVILPDMADSPNNTTYTANACGANPYGRAAAGLMTASMEYENAVTSPEGNGFLEPFNGYNNIDDWPHNMGVIGGACFFGTPGIYVGANDTVKPWNQRWNNGQGGCSP